MADKNFKVKSGLQVPSLTTAGPVVTDASGNVTSSATLPIAQGGTGQTTANNALNALLPLQTGNNNYFLQTNQVSAQWAKVFYQTIENAGVAVTPRGRLNIIGATFTDDAVNDETIITFSGSSVTEIDGGAFDSIAPYNGGKPNTTNFSNIFDGGTP